MLAAAGLGGTLGVAPTVPASPAFAAVSGAELVIPAAARAVPRATQILTAGTTGFLWLQEGDDRLLWTDYATGVTTALEQRLRSPLGYDFNSGYFRRMDADFEIGGAGSDTVALYYASPSPKVALLTAASGVIGEVPIPEGHSYRGTYGGVVVTGSEDGAAFHLWRPVNGGVTRTPVTGLPADATNITVADGDGNALILRYETADGPHWSLTGLTDGTAVALPDRLDAGDSWEVSGFGLAADSVLRLRLGRSKIDVYSRQDLGAEPRTVEVGAFGYDASYAVTGTHLLAMNHMMIGNSRFRGEPLWAVPATGDDPDRTRVLAIGAHGLVPTPDGSVLVAGAEEDVSEGDTDLGIYRVREAADGSVARERLTAVQPMPAQIHGLSLGGGVLTTVANSTIYEPSTIIGAYRSTWLTTPAPGSAPSVVRSTVDGYAGGRDGFCSLEGDRDRCIRMFADGTGRHGREHATEQDLTMLMVNGSTGWGPSVDTGAFSPYLSDLSGRYGVVTGLGGGGQDQYVVRFPTTGTGTVLQKRGRVGSAVWGSTLWSGSAEGGTVQATGLPSGTAGESFTTANGCTPSKLQAVGRWVYWTCVDYWGTHHGSGVFDRVSRKTVTAPAGEVLLGDGFLVAYVAGAGLQLSDLTTGAPARTLVTEAELGSSHGAGTSWTVDRFGGGVAYADDAQRVHVVPTGVPASALTVIDSDVSSAAVNWSGTWWLSKPAASWQVTIRDRAGATLRTLTGSGPTGQIRATWDGRDAAGNTVADGAFTWGLTAQPADGQGAALSVGDPAPAAALRATKAPAVTGTVRVGATVHATAGTWSPSATKYTYQWYANGAVIKGATGAAYQIQAGALGKRLTVRVTASRAGHPSGSASSAASAVVARGPAAKATARPKISGKAKVGRTVRATAGSWSPKADSYRYEWRLNGKLIRGATAATLKLKSSMRGKKLTVTVIARKAGCLDGRATSVAVTVRS
jgi:hypothetical protein